MKTLSPIGNDTATGWRNPFAIALVVYYLSMALVGMLVPDDILKSYAWAREFSDFMASIVPQIDRITALNLKPDVNRFYFSVLWAASPFGIGLVLFWGFSAMKSGQAAMWVTPFQKAVLPMVFGCLAIFGFLEVNWIVDPTLKLSKHTFGSATGRAFFAQIFVLGPIFFAPGVIAWGLGWLTGYIPRNIEKQRSQST